MKIIFQIIGLLAISMMGIAHAQQQQNNTMPINDPILSHLMQLANDLSAGQFPGYMDPSVQKYKLFLAAQLANGYGNATARVDTLNYLCQIDVTYCDGGDNYPLR